MSPSRPSLPYAPRETRATDGEYQLGGCARVALVSLTLSAGFGLAGCAAIDDLKVSIFQWLDPVNFTGEGEELLGYAPETRLIPPAEIPKQAAKAPSKRIKPATRKLQRPQTVVLPPKKPPISDRDSPRGRIRCDRGLPIPKRRHPSTRGFAPSAGACPQKLSKCTYFREEREEPRVGRESLPRTAIVAANQAGAGDLET